MTRDGGELKADHADNMTNTVRQRFRAPPALPKISDAPLFFFFFLKDELN